MSTVTININGMDYNLKGRESEDYLAEIAKYVDEKVKDIMSNNRKLSSTAGATLVALNIADELFKADEEIEALIKKNTSLEERNSTLKERIKEIRDELESIEVLKKVIEDLKNDNLVLKDELENVKKNSFINKENEDEYKDKFITLSEQYKVMEEECKKNKLEKDNLKEINKDTKFQLQNLKYRVLDLEKKLIDSQVNLALEKKKDNALLK